MRAHRLSGQACPATAVPFAPATSAQCSQTILLACHMSTSLQKAKRASSTRTRYLRQPDSKENPEASSMKASDDEIIKQFQE